MATLVDAALISLIPKGEGDTFGATASNCNLLCLWAAGCDVAEELDREGAYIHLEQKWQREKVHFKQEKQESASNCSKHRFSAFF